MNPTFKHQLKESMTTPKILAFAADRARTLRNYGWLGSLRETV